MTRTILAAAIAVVAMATAASADKPIPMPVDFVGEWCFADTIFDGKRDRTGHEVATHNYRLPSWTDGECKRETILAIRPYDFMTGDLLCRPTKPVRVVEDRAPSGTGFASTVVAECYRNGPINPSTAIRHTFEFSRYKGNIYMRVN
jgi:hypothetical protein